MKRIPSWVLIPAITVLLSCGEHTPTGRGIDAATDGRVTISDASTGGRTGFYFLSPLAAAPAARTGPFDPNVSPTVEICVVGGGACTSTIATYSMTSGPGSETVRLDAANDLYTVTWHTARFSLDPAKTYRIRVLLWALELGYADVDLVANASELKRVDRLQFVPVVNGASFPVKFRVEESALWAGLAPLTLRRSTAPPGAMLEIAGFDPGVATPNDLALFVANRSTGVSANGTGAIMAGVPLFLGADLWPAPPAGKQDVILLRDGIPVAGARQALTITPLHDAPGASQRALSALETLASGFTAMARALPAPTSAEEGYYGAITGALGAMIGGSDARSLRSVLQSLASSDPRALRLLDAWLASSGAVSALQQYAGHLQGLSLSPATAASRAVSASGGTAPGALLVSTAVTPTVTSDIELAKKMQLYEVVKLFSETVIAGTNTTFSNYIANIAGFIAFAQVGVANAPSLTPVAITAALLAMTDFVANKIIVALMPANIVTFNLSVATSQLDLGQLTDATLRIVAANNPPTVGINDAVGLILAGLGALPAPDVQTFTQGLQAVASFYLNLMQSLLSQFAAAHPALNLDVSLGQLVPAMQWEAVVTDRRLVERLSQTPTIIDGDLVEVNWRASLTNTGEGRIFAQPSLGPSGILINPPAGIVYAAGSFGDDILSTNVVAVQVGAVNVTVSPGTATVQTLGTRQFSATVTGTTNTAVTWSTDDPGGGVTAGGLYTAGSTPGIYAVTATSAADPTKSGAAVVVVQDVSISISPTSATLAPGGHQQFVATVNGTASTAVTWTATGGTVTANGLYTAGSVPGNFNVTATSMDDPTQSSTATVTVGGSGVLLSSLRRQTYAQALAGTTSPCGDDEQSTLSPGNSSSSSYSHTAQCTRTSLDATGEASSSLTYTITGSSAGLTAVTASGTLVVKATGTQTGALGQGNVDLVLGFVGQAGYQITGSLSAEAPGATADAVAGVQFIRPNLDANGNLSFVSAGKVDGARIFGSSATISESGTMDGGLSIDIRAVAGATAPGSGVGTFTVRFSITVIFTTPP